jgi:hypothetical protein
LNFITKKDVAILLSSSIGLIVVVVATLLFANTTRQKGRDDNSQQKFDVFVSNVQSGKWQLTTGEWLKGMRLEHNEVVEYQKACFEIGEAFLCLGWGLLVCILWQTGTVFIVRKRLQKQ